MPKSSATKSTWTARRGKGLYPITPGDLTPWVGPFSFNEEEFRKLIHKRAPNFVKGEPATYPLVSAAQIRACLGADYTGKKELPPHAAYPVQIMRLYRNHPDRTSTRGIGRLYWSRYPHNHNVKGELRNHVGMNDQEYAEYFWAFADESTKRAKRLTETARSKNQAEWYKSELAEEKREHERAKAELQRITSEAKNMQTQLIDRDAKLASNPKNTMEILATDEGVVPARNANSKKKRATDDVSPKHGKSSAKRTKFDATVLDADDTDTPADI